MKSQQNRQRLIELGYERINLRLNSQLTAALAADSRALAFSSVVMATGAILAGLAESSAAPNAMLIGAVLQVFAAGLAGWAARPAPFVMPGARYDDLEEDIRNNYEFHKVLRELAGYSDQQSRLNDEFMARNAKFLIAGFVVSAIGLLIGVGPQIDSYTQSPLTQ